jgi:hypothetical protein
MKNLVAVALRPFGLYGKVYVQDRPKKFQVRSVRSVRSGSRSSTGPKISVGIPRDKGRDFFTEGIRT